MPKINLQTISVFTFLSIASVFTQTNLVNAQETIVNWDFTGQPGNQVSSPSSFSAANITGSPFLRGPGLGPNSGSNSFNSNGWESNITPVNTDTEYISFGFSVNTGFQVNLDNLQIGTRSSSTGPGNLGLYYSGDNYSTLLGTFTQVGTNNLFSTINLTGLPNLTGSVQFRIVEIGNVAAGGGVTSSAGTFRVINFNSDHTQINGTICAGDGPCPIVPEPTTILGTVALSFVPFLKKKSQKLNSTL